MASVVKRAKSRFWTACYTDRDGRQLKRTTKTTVKSEAKELAIEFERIERLAAKGELITTQMKKVMNEVSERVTGESLIAPTTETYLKEWLVEVGPRATLSTVERYSHSVKLFVEAIGEKAQKPITAITPRDVEGFLTARLKSKVAPKTAVVDLKIINIAFRRAQNFGLILKNPVAAVRPPKIVSSEREVFTQEEIQKLLKAAPNVEWQTMILLGYFVGARLSDCVRMAWENINPEMEIIQYQAKKTGKSIPIPIHYNLLEHLHFLSTFGTHGFLCPKLAAKATGGRRGLSENFKRILRDAGVDTMTGEGKGLRKFSKRTFHSLRHSFNSALANAGVPQEVRMKLTGHASKAMNSGYTHLQMATLKNAVTKMPLFGSLPEKTETSEGNGS